MSEVSLKRRNFLEWKSGLLETAQADDKFTDVTLVAKDGQSVSAHRIILSCASPFFADLLSLQVLHPHPVILLPMVEGFLLGTLLDFLYLGEVLLPSPESLEGFMQMVTCLGLEGGMGVEELENDPDESRSSVMEDSIEGGSDLGRGNMNQKPAKLLEPSAETMVKTEETAKVSGVKYVQRSQAPSLKEKTLACTFCDYRIHRNDLLRVHMNSKHDVEKFKCAVASSCSKVYSSKSNLRLNLILI